MDPIKLQQDLRNNQEDVQSYMRDLRNWTDQIKKKDKELTSQSKRAQPTESSQSKGSGDSKRPKAPSPTEGGGKKRTVRVENEPSEEVLRLKEAGNECLKNKEYEKAITHYSTAMKLDPNYHVLPANRGMAYLKLNSFEKAEEDCGKAVALDPGYIKGYLRRGTARLELGKLQLAKEDYQKVLKLEPHNPQAKRSMERIKLEEDKQARLKTTKRKSDLPTSSDPSSKTSRPLDQTPPVKEKPAHLRSKTQLKKIHIEQVGNDAELENYINGSSSVNSEGASETGGGEAEQPPSINGDETPNGTAEPSEPEEKQCPAPEEPSAEASVPKVDQAPAPDPKETPPPEVVATPAMAVPAAPRSSYEFVRDWKLLRTHGELRSQYLRQIPPGDYASIFKQALEESTLVEILRVAETLPAAEIGSHLRGLSQVQRVDVLVMFMSSQDRKLLQGLVSRCEEDGQDMSDVKKRVGV
ncbi:RNA polymerase II-associated protein 3-like [Amphibalanus amphitrite]|uniref:RNA polymerase II-associated protein 3-like n=1 Tax=Amphibalanus amphitrite TaxID=1232801 RepID=UPI001C8FC972|nr:RNA polymerase II-associated protein 3-like [Amphibalanus amphitrite]XP_043194762.1 RNA polymerase II-associated protein 3-like [Amphibalanus amphitrite]XP_043194763.1 RNA polymerase II-associated protein 3-like [Amphibalanus amphitrite]XP_043194764.1 RNA polymerase II-associated protein 3-like [Amphibalanus amphitrite]XP_043194765.1 RNA polymerase II-associated protein 3-like [Amphibalanus amphitrite]XP_043194766.1 RNA polymerase II-associated protein 3-like [Amphibalanus amphitrite]